MTRRGFLAAAAVVTAQAQSARPAPLGIVHYSFMTVRKPDDTLEFLDYCHKLGAAGAQFEVTNSDPAYLRRIRQKLEETGLYYEAIEQRNVLECLQYAREHFA